MRPLDCFAALAMTGWELARLFLGVALLAQPLTRPLPARAGEGENPYAPSDGQAFALFSLKF